MVLFSCPLVATAQSVLYITTGNGSYSNLYKVNTTTFDAVLIGPAKAGAASLTLTGLAVHPGTGVVYGILGSENTPARELYTFDPDTAQGVLVGSFDPNRATDIAFAPNGTLYSWGTRGGPLGTLNLGTGAITTIGAGSNGTGANGIAFTSDGTLYLAGPLTGGSLYKVNLTTGDLTVVAAFTNVPAGANNINAMTLGPDGMLYAVTRNNSALLLSINPATANVTLLTTFTFSADALTFVPVPEPSTWALLLLGIGMIGVGAWRRSRAARAPHR